MYVEKPTDPGESLVGLSNLFFLTWNFSVNFNLEVFRSLKTQSPGRPIIQRRLIDLSKIEKLVQVSFT